MTDKIKTLLYEKKVSIVAQSEKLDIALISVAVGYVCIPIVIFFCGWLNPIIAVIGSILLISLAFFTIREICQQGRENTIELFHTSNVKFWAVIGIIALLWVYFSGIGNFTYQNSDYWARNPIFRDLSEQSWPVIFDLSKESEIVQSICGNEKVAFSYYFCWWLPVSFLSKLFGMNSFVRNIFLYFWAVLGILEIIYLLCRKLAKCSWAIPTIMIFFSGLDIIVWWLHNQGGFSWTNHIEWWASYFQYSANTTQLYWVFNQSIPIWLTMALILQFDSSKYVAALGSLVFAYSPWATFGVVPFAVAATIKDKKSFRKAINVINILVPAIMLLIFGTFYLASSGSDGKIGIIFSFHQNEKKRVLANYIVFVLLEFGIYFLTMKTRARKYEYYWITLVELFIFPLVIIRDGNFIMRGSIPALFLLMYYVMRFLLEEDTEQVKQSKKILIALLCIGAITPLCEINRSVSTSTATNDLLQEDVYSFANIKTENEGRIATTKSQFFIYDYEDTLFFKYLAR